MVRLREIPRTATFAWSPGSALPLIATGTRAGAVDADFSNETQLELWDLDLGNTEQGVELQPAASIGTDSRFHDIAWGKATSDHPRGVIAGALENGSLDLWDADKLLKGQDDAFLSRTSKHSGAIKALQFNPFKPELLATAGAKGELFVFDLNKMDNPIRLGNSAARADDFEALDWNKKVPHILVTGSSGGFVTVWDVKAKKESLTLNNFGRKAVSAVAWDPDMPTKLITAIPNDTDPLILMWDLRNSNAPERTLRAHEQGVLALSWCPQDGDLLLSCGKDNRTICWNPHTGQPYGEFPVVTNWTFQTRWNPHNPSLLATASFDGKIAVQTIQNTKSEASATIGSQNESLDGADFFSKAQTEPQGAAFSLPKPPKWLERPIGASFGFGGKVISFGLDGTEGGKSRHSEIRISSFAVDAGVGAATEAFEKSLKEHNFGSICETKISEAKSDEEKADWEVIESLISNNPRKKLVEYLGFSNEVDEAADGVSKMGPGEDGSKDDVPETNVNGSKENRMSAFFDNNGDDDNFLSNLAATKGAKTNNPFHMYTGSESEPEKQITRALMLGEFEKALDVCLTEDRMSDAFMIAICGGSKCIDKAQAAYFTKKSEGPNYLRLLASVVGKNLWDVVYNADLANWKEVMATLCTYADQTEFPDLCEALGDRLEESLKDAEEKSVLRKDASFCYLAGSKLEKVVTIWIEELQENEQSGMQQAADDSTFSVHARSLQNLIERVTVFREVTKFQDTDRHQNSGWKLAPLYEKYTEYADVVAAHGQLQIAEKYLDLLPAQYPAAEVARNRVKQASKRATPQVAPKATATATAQQIPQRPQQPAMGAFQPTQAPASSTPAYPYPPTPSNQQSNPYNPPSTGSYNPPGYQPSRQPTGSIPPPPQTFGGPPQSQALNGPPRNFNQPPPVSAPSKATNMSNWNDTPDGFFKPPTSRRGTPGVGASTISSPFPNQQNLPPPPTPGAPINSQQRSTPPLGPPPKGSAPLPRMGSPYTGGPPHSFQQPDRPSSTSGHTYAPSSGNQIGGPTQPPAIPRGASPYNAPPSGAPPSNRYAPAPPAQGSATPGQQNSSMPPPPMGGARQTPGPPNPYSQQQPQFSQQQNAPSPYAPSQPPPQQSNQMPPRGPPQGPPQGSRPGTGQSQSAKVSTPVPSKYPPGDRSHIPSNAQPIYEILDGDMQRVKSRAPPSFKAQVNDTEKRLNILFDHLNNEDLLKRDTVQSMVELSQAMQARNYEDAQAIHIDILTNKTDECGNWMTGVKRLIGMSRATP
ncbi:MAG: protein transport protein S31 [Pycnora praestabilis]|nr:MAG: protein transport protein S31 [Pycnora praestabilis]